MSVRRQNIRISINGYIVIKDFHMFATEFFPLDTLQNFNTV